MPLRNRTIEIPMDPLLLDVARQSQPPSDAGTPPASPAHPDGGSSPAPENNHPVQRKRARIEEDSGEEEGANPNIAHNAGPPPPPSNLPHLSATQSREIARGLASAKKLSQNSTQELHRFAQAPIGEKVVMAYALGLEIRDDVENVSKFVVSNGLPPALKGNVKSYTAAAFFSPNLTYYIGPGNSARSKALNKLVYNILVTCQIPNLPSQNDVNSTNEVLGAIGTTWVRLRSDFLKNYLEKRSADAADMDIASFTSRATDGTGIKITVSHYGRIAFLSREYRTFKQKHPTSNGGVKYWEWVDAALAQVRNSAKGDKKFLTNYFTSILTKDYEIFGEPIEGLVNDAKDRDDWQRSTEKAAAGLSSV